MRYRIRLLYGNTHSGSAHPPAILCGYFYAGANASALHIIASPPDVFTSQHPANASILHIITPQFIAHPTPSRSIFTLATSSRRSSCAGLSPKTFLSRSCHYVFCRFAINRPHAIRFFADLPPDNLMTLTLTKPGREFSSRFPVFDANIPFSRSVTLSRPTTSH